MKKILFLAGALLLATAAHAQSFGGFGGGSINSAGGNSLAPHSIGSFCGSCGTVDLRASYVTSAKNDGPFMPTSFQSYDEAVQGAGRS